MPLSVLLLLLLFRLVSPTSQVFAIASDEGGSADAMHKHRGCNDEAPDDPDTLQVGFTQRAHSIIECLHRFGTIRLASSMPYTFHIGTSGWSYDHWHGVLYPHGSQPSERLGYYVQHYETVELNSSFYQWPGDAAFARWRKRLPTGFRMSVKAPRALTHGKRLYAPEAWIGRITSGLHALGPDRGVLLVQTPPGLAYDDRRLDYFLAQLPPWVQVALEFRHPSWHQDATFALLERYQAAYCVMSGAYLPCILRATAPYVYVRLHGPDPHYLYAGSYSDNDLHWWAERIREWMAQGREVFAYFNNDGGGNAVRNASMLRRFVEG